jgi:hypothetical protein
MRFYKTVLHILISIASIFGFIGGWASIAHSNKPSHKPSQSKAVQAQEFLPALDPLPALQPIQSFNTVSSGLQSFTPSFRPLNVNPVFITGGS